MSILLTPKERDKLWVRYEKNDPTQSTSWDEFICQAQLKKGADAIESMMADDWSLEEMVEALREKKE